MKHKLSTLAVFVALFAFALIAKECSAQAQKLDSVRLNYLEQAKLTDYVQGDKAKEMDRIQERISFFQRELQLMQEAKDDLLNLIMVREEKRGIAKTVRNGYLIIQIPAPVSVQTAGQPAKKN